MKNTYCLYYLADENDEPYYIGKTKDFEGRKKDHIKSIESGCPLPKYHKARKLIRNGIPFKMKKLERNIPEKDINNAEIEAIKTFKEVGFYLFNLTKGGEGGDTFTNNPNKEKTREKCGKHF